MSSSQDLDAFPEHASPGVLARRVLAMSWPNLLYALLDQGIRLVDMWLVGRLNSDAIAAVGLSQRVMILIAVISMAIASGATPIAGQAYGGGDYGRVRHVASQALRAMLVLGVVLSLVLFLLGPPILQLLQAKDAVQTYGSEYLSITALGLTGLFLNFTLLALFRALGQVKTPVVLILVMNLLNVAISYPLVIGWPPYVPSLGVAGAAWGTIISRAVGAGIGFVIWLRRTRNYPCPPGGFFDLALLKEILTVGLPIGVTGAIRMGAVALFFAVFAGLPGPALAATSLTTQMRMMLIMPALMFQVALQTLVSHSLGRGNFREAKRLTLHMQLMGGILMGVVTVVLFLLARPIMAGLASADSPDPGGLLIMSTRMFRISLCGQLPATAAIIFGGALIGGGDTRPLLVFTVCSEWLIMLPLAAGFRFLLKLPPEHIWWAPFCSSSAILLMYLWRYRQGKWQRQL